MYIIMPLEEQFASLSFGTFLKFKDRSLWNFNNPHDWSSQSINILRVQNVIWDENGIGRTLEVVPLTYESELGYTYQVYFNGELQSISFKEEAFETNNNIDGDTDVDFDSSEDEEMVGYILRF